jgi:hypothetical protein
MADDARRVARKAESSTPLRALARAGFAANGIVHVIIGVIVLAAAFGAEGESDQAGAFTAIAEAPLGFAALWLLAVALWALAVWHVIEGVLAARGDTAEKWRLRVSEWGQSVVFLALGVLAASVALGARPDADETAQDVSRGVLVVPGGAFVLGAVGLGIAVAGIAFVVMGVRRSFEQKMAIPDTPAGTGIKTLGIVGFIAKGVALLILGVLLLVAAVRVDPEAAGGLDAAVDALLGLPYGPWLAGAIGGGLVVYGAFCILRARYARL